MAENLRNNWDEESWLEGRVPILSNRNMLEVSLEGSAVTWLAL